MALDELTARIKLVSTQPAPPGEHTQLEKAHNAAAAAAAMPGATEETKDKAIGTLMDLLAARIKDAPPKGGRHRRRKTRRGKKVRASRKSRR
jgi:hypothetical protein